MKPFRLINQRESLFLEATLSRRLKEWCDRYAINPLSCHISLNTEAAEDVASIRHYASDNTPICLSSSKASSFIQQVVFGQIAKSFDAIAEQLHIDLLNLLCDTTSLHQQVTFDRLDWFYKGSPCISLSIESNDASLVLYFHPTWVINALPQTESLTPLTPLNEALNEASLTMHVVLNSFTLPLSNISQLQVGDVIKTDHPLSTPLSLTHVCNTICHVELGEQSIQITRKP